MKVYSQALKSRRPGQRCELPQRSVGVEYQLTLNLVHFKRKKTLCGDLNGKTPDKKNCGENPEILKKNVGDCFPNPKRFETPQ